MPVAFLCRVCTDLYVNSFFVDDKGSKRLKKG